MTFNPNNLKFTIRDSSAGRWHDVMDGASRIEAKVSDHGSVALIDCMPRLVWIDAEHPDHLNTVEASIVQAARVSYQKGTKKVSEDRGLVRYLMRNNHNTPIEMVQTKWHCRMPIFVARQWVRHRMVSLNEISARYSELPGDFWIPKADELRAQSTGNKQVAEGQVEQVSAEEFVFNLQRASDNAYREYQIALKNNIGREIARTILPLNIMTEWIWKIDLHNLFHFLSLRTHAHAQKEIRDYALPMVQIMKTIAPVAMEAFEDYRVNSLTLSGPEIEAFKAKLNTVGDNKRENEEYQAKLARMGVTF